MLDIAACIAACIAATYSAQARTHTHTHKVWPGPLGHSNASKDARNTVLPHSAQLLKAGYWMHAAKPRSAKTGGKE